MKPGKPVNPEVKKPPQSVWTPQPVPQTPRVELPKPIKANRVGQKVIYRPAIEKNGVWIDGPGEINREGVVISWGTKWVYILNVQACKVEYAVPQSARLESNSTTKVA
jgi:hypothetical protein